MWKRLLRWLMESVDITVGVEDGIISVAIMFLGQTLWTHEFDLETVTRARTSAVWRSVGNGRK